MNEFVVYSQRGEAVVRVSSLEEAERLRRILGGRIEERMAELSGVAA